MHNEIEETVERLAALGASREEIRDALLGLDRKWTGKRSRSRVPAWVAMIKIVKELSQAAKHTRSLLSFF
jgi:hypothetical protein